MLRVAAAVEALRRAEDKTYDELAKEIKIPKLNLFRFTKGAQLNSRDTTKLFIWLLTLSK